MLIETLAFSLLPVLVLGLLLILLTILCIWGLFKVLAVLDKPAQGPKQKLINQLGRVLTPIDSNHYGKVLVMGEIWDALSAESGQEIAKDTEIRVCGFDSIDPQVLRVSQKLAPLPPEASSTRQKLR